VLVAFFQQTATVSSETPPLHSLFVFACAFGTGLGPPFFSFFPQAWGSHSDKHYPALSFLAFRTAGLHPKEPLFQEKISPLSLNRLLVCLISFSFEVHFSSECSFRRGKRASTRPGAASQLRSFVSLSFLSYYFLFFPLIWITWPSSAAGVIVLPGVKCPVLSPNLFGRRVLVLLREDRSL